MGLRRTIGRWAVVAVAVPVAAEVAERLGRRLEATRGPTAWSRGLHTGARGLRRLKAAR